ncbi:hypothetical protein J5289_20200 [Rhizobium sp. B230/85]|uniref:hypothetical protein n=1 Tax=unclassified Rhizobium TaxID=2613769 RepID=UPI001ADB0127|nr:MULTISPECIES: hypothetical protein [unclassified Rhizobium]MBO9135339.1 hypothetical protein [Rhizobium sp. B209b/85]MBO9171567.1 hypothetical protein [Rhizobium sp. L245/93]QXZ98854.1 hypothetical protein J5289_20200 [Rhizobium sp. B230/85]
MRQTKYREMQAIAQTIRKLVVPGIKPETLIEVVREVHPNASKKEIARAAFLTVILSAKFDSDDTQTLHDLAVGTQDDARGQD